MRDINYKLRATSASNIEVDEEFCSADIGEKFLILDKKGKKRILVFESYIEFQMLSEALYWHADT